MKLSIASIMLLAAALTGPAAPAAEYTASVSQTFQPSEIKNAPERIPVYPLPGSQYYKWKPGNRIIITDRSGVKYVATVSEVLIYPRHVTVTDVRPYVESGPQSGDLKLPPSPAGDIDIKSQVLSQNNEKGAVAYFSQGDLSAAANSGLQSGAVAGLSTYIFKGLIYDSEFRAHLERHQQQMAAIDQRAKTSAVEMNKRAQADASLMSQAIEDFDRVFTAGSTVTEYPRVYGSTPEKRGLGEDEGRRAYRSPTDPSNNLLTEFAYPTKNRYARGFGDPDGIVGGPGEAAQIRTPGKPTNTPSVFNPGDAAGGTFTSGRSGVTGVGRKAFGEDARRLHAGLDFVTRPGDLVYAPMSGTVVSIKPPDEYGLQEIYIRSPDGVTAGILYTKPIEGLTVRAKVIAGTTQIGTAQLIVKKYGASTPNHIHVQFEDLRGWRFDPWTNQYAPPMPAKPAP